MRCWTRRQILKSLAVGSLGASWLTGRRLPASAEPLSIPSGAIVRGGDAAEQVRQAIKALGGMSRFVQSGQNVVIKPNIGWDRSPEQAATTNPLVVAEIARLARDAGAERVRVMDHTCNDPRRCYKHSGIEEAAEAAGAEVIHLRKGRGQEVEINGRLVKRWPVFREVLEADVLINVPIVKHHGLCRATLGMKNWYGAIDGRRAQLHQEVPQSSVDLAVFFRPALTVLDGMRILLRNGPQGGNLDDVAHPGVLMAGTDPVAIDAFGGSLLNLTPEDLPHLALAEQAGLGSAKLDRADILTIDL